MRIIFAVLVATSATLACHGEPPPSRRGARVQERQDADATARNPGPAAPSSSPSASNSPGDQRAGARPQAAQPPANEPEIEPMPEPALPVSQLAWDGIELQGDTQFVIVATE